ncbi:hypothetical protein D4T97_001575 [Siminovitchia acidinfaciens]|uniref:Uncharacterized protein n=1 Tax=Siminovitchia acidinfaciens TaxID=2321395 RepID=A0A429Y748_9BACI|nr:hypothetical protein [Siminovitchia acidinfaciens]RST77212.1 hypothetical protein D4T97_001575 [Siminovitchia acidinfaciens]VEF46615.1 Uncharacterised protein [Bacillus freudenreichii]
MSEVRSWLREQRVQGGESLASAMFRGNADAESYLRKIVEIVEKKEDIELTVVEGLHGFEVLWYDDIVWFGRDIDIDLLRTVSASMLEELLEKRIKRLREYRAPALDLFSEYFNDQE